jgi:hypothetical protein
MRSCAVLIFLLWSNTPSPAWGDLGHRVVCEIAFAKVLPRTRPEIRRLLKRDAQFHFFPDGYIFPEYPRKCSSEHFINLARNVTGPSAAACLLPAKCVLSEVDEHMSALASDAGDEKKLLCHCVRSLHEPVQVSFADERGGNAIEVGGVSVHSICAAGDTCLCVRHALRRA